MVDRACALFRDGQRHELETLTNEIRDEISKTIILNDENWEGLRCRICPSCAATIPTCFCICLECEAQLISTGRFHVNVSSGDDDDDREPKCPGMPGGRRGKRMITRQHKGRMVEMTMILVGLMVLHGLALTCSIRVRGNRCDRAADPARVWLLTNTLTTVCTGLAVSV